jgi:ABC-type sugar transport system permease subunit
MRSIKGKTTNWGKIVPYLFIAPFFISFLVFFLYPAAYSFYLSLTRYNGAGAPRFVGLRNYITLFKYDFFWQAVRNTFFYVIFGVGPSIILAFLLSVVIYSRNVKWKTLYKILIYLPQTMATVAASLVFIVLLGTNTGVINRLLGLSIPFLEDPYITRWAVILLLTWRGIGWYLLVFLAGLATIDPEVLESARVDGARAWQSLIRITVPMMRPIFAYTIVIGTINCLKIFTEPRVLLLSATALPVMVQSVVTMLVNNVQGGVFGSASAIGWVLFVIIFSVYMILYKGIGFGREEG